MSKQGGKLTMDQKSIDEIRTEIQIEINNLEQYYKTLKEDDYLERGITLGKINGLLKAKLIISNRF